MIFDLSIGFYDNGAVLEDINIYCAGSEEEKKCYSEIENVINKKSGMQFIRNNTLIFDRNKYRNGTVSIAIRTTSTRRESKYYSFCFDSNDKFIYDDDTKHENIEFLGGWRGCSPPTPREHRPRRRSPRWGRRARRHRSRRTRRR